MGSSQTMKFITKGSVVTISLGVLTVLIALSIFSASLNFEVLKTIKSPDQAAVVHVARSQSEGGLAPYGTNIFIAPWWQPFPYHYRKPFFAGYCGRDLKVYWKSSEQLVVSCTAEKVIFQSQQYGKVNIEYFIKLTEAQNKSVKRRE